MISLASSIFDTYTRKLFLRPFHFHIDREEQSSLWSSIPFVLAQSCMQSLFRYFSLPAFRFHRYCLGPLNAKCRIHLVRCDKAWVSDQDHETSDSCSREHHATKTSFYQLFVVMQGYCCVTLKLPFYTRLTTNILIPRKDLRLPIQDIGNTKLLIR